MMTTLGDGCSVGTGDRGVNRLGLAIRQMRAKTKVSGEEMRQLTEAGVPAWEILAQAVGKPIPKVMKLASEGKIAADVFIQAFQTFSQQNYGGMMERQSQTFSGAMSNIKDSLTQAAATAFQPLFAKLGEGAQRVAEFVNSVAFDQLVENVQESMVTVADYLEQGLGYITEHKDAIIGALKGIRVALIGLGTAAAVIAIVNAGAEPNRADHHGDHGGGGSWARPGRRTGRYPRQDARSSGRYRQLFLSPRVRLG